MKLGGRAVELQAEGEKLAKELLNLKSVRSLAFTFLGGRFPRHPALAAAAALLRDLQRGLWIRMS